MGLSTCKRQPTAFEEVGVFSTERFQQRPISYHRQFEFLWQYPKHFRQELGALLGRESTNVCQLDWPARRAFRSAATWRPGFMWDGIGNKGVPSAVHRRQLHKTLK